VFVLTAVVLLLELLAADSSVLVSVVLLLEPLHR
jgi:hypothetical protein